MVSVMALVARSIDAPVATAREDISVEPTVPTTPTTTTTALTTTTKSDGQKILDGWEKIKPIFELIYKGGLQVISWIGSLLFGWLLRLVGLTVDL